MTPHNEAKPSIHSTKWSNAIKDELKFMKDYDVWDLVKLPKGKKLIGCIWVFKIKRDLKGNAERYNTCFVAKGTHSNRGH